MRNLSTVGRFGAKRMFSRLVGRGMVRWMGQRGARTALGLAATWMVASLAVAGDASLVNRASQQGMLAQRVVKAYAQIGLNVLPTAAMNQLTSAMSAFDANLLELDRAAGDDESRRLLGDLALAWQPLKAGAMSPISRERALDLSRETENIELSSRRLVQLLQDRAGTPASRLVSLAGRQRLLSQRIAKAYMLASWGIESVAVRDELDAAVNEFSGSLNTLLASGENTPEIRRELDEMALQWEWLRTAIAAEGATSYRLIVAEATESILVSTERIARMYESTGKR